MSTTTTPTKNTIRVSIPTKIRRRIGRKEILLPDAYRPAEREHRQSYQEAIAIAVARGHLWCEMLESGRFSSLREMSARFEIAEAYMARLVRLASLAPDIVESILDGNEPRDFSLNTLIAAVPKVWTDQRRKYGFGEPTTSLASNDTESIGMITDSDRLSDRKSGSN